MRRQCFLRPVRRPLDANRRLDAVTSYFTHINKGKVYPYASWRATRAGRLGLLERELRAKLREMEKQDGIRFSRTGTNNQASA